MTLLGGAASYEGGRRRSSGLKTKTLRRMLKKKGMKTTGKKATLMKRLHMRGGVGSDDVAPGTSEADKALDAPAEFENEAASGSSGTSVQEEGGKRRRRRSRRRREEEGGGRRKSRRGKEMLGY